MPLLRHFGHAAIASSQALGVSVHHRPEAPDTATQFPSPATTTAAVAAAETKAEEGAAATTAEVVVAAPMEEAPTVAAAEVEAAAAAGTTAAGPVAVAVTAARAPARSRSPCIGRRSVTEYQYPMWYVMLLHVRTKYSYMVNKKVGASVHVRMSYTYVLHGYRDPVWGLYSSW